MADLPPEIELEVIKRIDSAEKKIVESLTRRYLWLAFCATGLLGLAGVTATSWMQTAVNKSVIQAEVAEENYKKLSKRLEQSRDDLEKEISQQKGSIESAKIKMDEIMTSAQGADASVSQLRQFGEQLAAFYSHPAVASATVTPEAATGASKVEQAAKKLGAVIYIQYNGPVSNGQISPVNLDYVNGLRTALTQAGYAAPPPEFKAYVTQDTDKLYYFNQLRDSVAEDIVEIVNKYASTHGKPSIKPSAQYDFASKHRDGEMSLQIWLK